MTNLTRAPPLDSHCKYTLHLVFHGTLTEITFVFIAFNYVCTMLLFFLLHYTICCFSVLVVLSYALISYLILESLLQKIKLQFQTHTHSRKHTNKHKHTFYHTMVG